MSFTKGLTNLFMLSIATLAITSCVPKATEKKAVCGTNQAFSTVTRSCYSIEELRAKPVGTTSSASLTEETSKIITLTYTDANKDLGSSCTVSSISSNLEMMSPSFADGGVFDKADLVADTMGRIAAELGSSTTAMSNAITLAKSSLYYPTVTAQLNIFSTQANIILAAAASSGNALAYSYYAMGQQRFADLTAAMTNMTNRCECTGGICKTVAVPKLNKSGTAGFSYSITDVDGAGASKAVAVTIVAASSSTDYLKPVAQSAYFTFAESATSTPSSYAVTIPDAGDVSGTLSTSYIYKFKTIGTTYVKESGAIPGITPAVTGYYGKTPLGKVYGCMDLYGSTSTNDKTCIYVPNNGNGFDALVGAADHPNATRVIDDLTFTAKAKGVYGNNYTIQYFDLNTDTSISSPEVFGLTAGSAGYEAFIRVVGNAIKVYINPGITTSGQIAALVNAHTQAGKLVTVSVTGAGTNLPSPLTLTASPVSLATGLAAYDLIPYVANNTKTDSANDAAITVRINSTDDVPYMNSVGAASNSTPYPLEDSASPIIVDLSSTYTDVDTSLVSPFNYINTCDVTTIDILHPGTNFTAYSCSCVLNVCSASLTPIADLSSSTYFTFQYRIGSTDVTTGVTQYTEYRDYRYTITPVNDAPIISTSTITAVPVTVGTIGAQTMAEGGTFYIDVFVDPGGNKMETDQTLTLTAAAIDTTLFPSGSITVGETSPAVTGKKRITFTPAANQSGNTNVTLTLKDNGGTANSGVDTTNMTFAMTVTPVNNPPVFLSTITKIETNEGGAVQSDAFQVDEDAAGSSDENAQYIQIDSITSDNTSVLPISAITIFYDENDNGVEDLGERRCAGNQVGCTGSTRLESVITNDVKAHKFYLKLDPVDGISGNANITLTISDHIDPSDPLYIANPTTYLPLTNSLSTSFSLVVHPIAALHGGWTNISSVGLKTNKAGEPVAAADISCGFSLATETNNCGSSYPGGCTGTASPNGVVVPSAANTVYWDSANLRCYRSTGTTAYTWVDHNTSCPITKGRGTLTTLTTALTTVTTSTITVGSTDGFKSSGTIVIDSEQFTYTGKTTTTFTGVTRASNSTTAAAHSAGANVDILDYPFVKDAGSTPATPLVRAANQYYYQTSDKTCHQSYYNNTGALVWGTTNYEPAKVTLSWKQFTMVGSGSDSSVQISGWNVYRREVGSDYNFKGGHLKSTASSSTTSFSIPDPSVRTFTDTTAVAGRVYYYVVRPVDNLRLFPTYTPESFSEVRVIASPSNYSFVHRWIVNQEMCNGMNITTTTTPYHVDQTNNFRCEYSGPGSVNISGVNYYDYGKDLLVDTYESGCAYAAAPKCTTNAGCVGIGAPSAYTATRDDLYYDRSSGACYVNTSATTGSTWTLFQTGTLNSNTVDKSNTALNAPLTNITRARAHNICNARTVPSLTYNDTGVVTPMSLMYLARLPNKKDYMAYSAQKLNVTDPEITEMEQGYSLNIQSRCNGSAASGLETAFTDAAIPSTSFIYSLPGTYSSNIRSLYTGSIAWSSNKGTEACVSRYGIQDLYGNVAEWVDDGMTCDPYSGQSKVCTVTQGGAGSFTADDFGVGVPYSFDNVIGPYNEGGDTIVTYPMTTLTADATSGDATLTVASTATFPSAGYLTIDSERLSYTGKTATTFTGVARGLSSTTAAAHFTSAVVYYAGIDDAHLTNWTFADQLFGANYFNYPLGLPLSSNINQSAFSAYMDWVLSIGPSSGITTNRLHEDGIIVNGSTGAVKSFAVGGSYLSGNRAGRFSSELINDSVTNRPDVGFRCIIPINTADTDNGGDYPVDDNYTYPY